MDMSASGRIAATCARATASGSPRASNRAPVRAASTTWTWEAPMPVSATRLSTSGTTASRPTANSAVTIPSEPDQRPARMRWCSRTAPPPRTTAGVVTG